MALRELHNENANVVPKTLRTSPLPKDKIVDGDSAKTHGAKRQQTDGPSSPPVYQNVYVRRKVDNEQSKLSPSQESKKIGRDGAKESDADHSETEEPKVESPIADSGGTGSSDSVEKPTTTPAISEPEKPITAAAALPEPEKPTTAAALPEPEKPTTAAAVIEPEKPTIAPAMPEPEKPNKAPAVPKKIEPLVASATNPQDDFQRSSTQYWKERYVRLQAYLENCDRSSQEDYIRNLRSLSAVGRSKHALELEKKAIQLLLEEGKEFQRMEVLNVLVKATPNDTSPESAQTPLQ